MMNKERRDLIVKELETHLDTRDKRFMFLKLEFPKLVSRINLEGSSHEAAYAIYFEFEKQGETTLYNLICILNSKLNCKL